MFWSKTWWLLVALVGALAMTVAILSARPLQRDLQRETGLRLERAQHSASLLLKVNARKWIDMAAQVSTDAVLVEALEQATKGPADLGLVHKTVQERLRYFNDKLKVDLVMATDARGRVIARVGLDEPVYKDGVEGFPLVADALRGLRGDDTWSLGGKLYRMAASPVIERDHYVGALVVGQEVAGELAQSMKRVLDVDVAFLLRGRLLAASAQLPLLGQLPLLVDQHFDEMAANGRSAPLLVDQGSDGYIVVLAPFAGEAEAHKAAYALIVRRRPTFTFAYLVGRLLSMDPKTLPWLQLAPIGGGLVLALIIGFLLLRVEAIGPLKRLARETQALARGDVTRLDDDRHPGKFGTVARSVNTTLDRLGSGARVPVSAPPLREPQFAREPRLDPFGRERPPARPPEAFARTAPQMDQAPEPFAARPEPFVALRPESPAFVPVGGPKQIDHDPPSVSEFDSRNTLERMREPMARDERPDTSELRQTEIRPSDMLGRGAVMTGPPAGPAIQTQASPSDTEPQETGRDFVESPSELLTPITHKLPTPRAMPSPTIPGVGVAGPSVQKDPFDDQTAVASPSKALLRAAAGEVSTVGTNPIEDGLETELRQVYRDFIETKQACGESTEGITYDKFSGKLRSNRQQLIQRYACKTVKFQVYIKDGKAALKATPVTT